MSRVALLEQINVLRPQVFVVLNSHKVLSDLFNCTDVRFLFQYGVGLRLRHLAWAVSFDPTNYEECLHRSEWVSDTFAYPSPNNKLVSTLRVSTSLKRALSSFLIQREGWFQSSICSLNLSEELRSLLTPFQSWKEMVHLGLNLGEKWRGFISH